jgi:hypothetical protein
MKSIWLSSFLLFALCMALVGCSQNGRSNSATTAKRPEGLAQVLLPVKVSGKWGYVNSSGQLVINPQFDAAEEFHEERAAVCLGKPCSWWESPGDSRWGYIDTSGKVIVTPQYTSASSFSEGLASVCAGDCSGSETAKAFSRGYLDRDGKLAIPMQFGITSDFKEGLAGVCIGKCTWRKDTGYSGKFGFIDHSGHFVINPQYDYVDDFKNGFASVKVGTGDDEKTGYIDKTGRVVWQPSN